MSTDRYTSPLVRALCKQGNAVYFFTGYEIPVPGEDLWIALAETEKELGLGHYTGAD